MLGTSKMETELASKLSCFFKKLDDGQSAKKEEDCIIQFP